MHLAVHDHRVDHDADVVDGDVLTNLHEAGLGVDIDRAQVRSVGEGERLRVDDGFGRQHGFDALGQVVRREGSKRQLLDGLVGSRRPAHSERAAIELDVARIRLEEVSGDGARLLHDALRCS